MDEQHAIVHVELQVSGCNAYRRFTGHSRGFAASAGAASVTAVAYSEEVVK